MTDNVQTALNIADEVKTGLDAATSFAPMMGPAAPWVMLADGVLNAVLGAAHTVYSSHSGGQSWSASLQEVFNHLDPTMPNSPALSPPSASASVVGSA